jgi:SNF2 family DNA or RNA helicase
MMEGLPIRTAVWSASMRVKEQHAVNQLLVAKEDVLDILLINVESLVTQGGVIAEAFLRAHYPMFVIDESSSIKNPNSARTKKALELRQFADYRRILDGTPAPNSPLDFYSQFEFLREGCLGFNSYVVFRNFFAKLLLTNQGGRRYYQITGYQNLDYLNKIIRPWSSRILKKECLDLPDKIYETLYVYHTPEQDELYGKIRDEAIALIAEGTITAVTAITALVKLHQINCGHVRTDDKQIIDIPNNRIQGLLDHLGKHDRKTIIWAHFNRDIEKILEALKSEFGMWSPVHYFGLSTPEQRAQAIDRFKMDKDCRFFVSSPATGGRGITLVEASDVVYYSQSFNLAHRLQSEDRCHRPGQRNNVTYTDIVIPRTVDVKIVKALKEKKDLAAEVLDLLPDLLAEQDTY